MNFRIWTWMYALKRYGGVHIWKIVASRKLSTGFERARIILEISFFLNYYLKFL